MPPFAAMGLPLTGSGEVCGNRQTDGRPGLDDPIQYETTLRPR